MTDLPDEQRLLANGEEAGSPPGDRRFRPDVEGLRAVAIVLVVCFHAGFRQVRGGFVGVDVFFVISGFVITGLLLRERSGTGRTDVAAFYARRARRILPAAVLVVVVTVVVSAVLLSHADAVIAASDGRWASLFLADAHDARVLPNILTVRYDPLGQFWSLAVEEQFYLVYPAVVIVVALVAHRGTGRAAAWTAPGPRWPSPCRWWPSRRSRCRWPRPTRASSVPTTRRSPGRGSCAPAPWSPWPPPSSGGSGRRWPPS